MKVILAVSSYKESPEKKYDRGFNGIRIHDIRDTLRCSTN